MANIRVLNLEDGEVVPCELSLLHGRAVCCNWIEVWRGGERIAKTEVVYGQFKAHFLLKLGLNEITIVGIAVGEEWNAGHSGEVTRLNFKLEYKPASREKIVKLHYLVARAADGRYQTPPGQDDSLETGMKKVKMMGLMIQLATAELLKRWFPDHGRRTFKLHPEVLKTTVSLTMDEAHKKTGHELWGKFAKDLSKTSENTINVCVMSFTRWDGKEAKAHTALGGGHLALFGGASMFCWPAECGDIEKCFRNTRIVDKAHSFHDGRGNQWWGSAATTIGACLHELCHCLSLPHPGGRNSGLGIMARGFEGNRSLNIGEQQPFFVRGSAVRLYYHPFLSPRKPKSSIQIFRDGDSGKFIVDASDGIRHIGFYANDENCGHREYMEPEMPPTFVILEDEKELRRLYDTKKSNGKLKISVIDNHGTILTKEVGSIGQMF